MNDEIIRMAREVGLGTVLCHNSIDGDRVWIGGADWHDELERFYRAAFAAGAAAEREACAKVCDEFTALIPLNGLHHALQIEAIADCAAAIRARGNV